MRVEEAKNATVRILMTIIDYLYLTCSSMYAIFIYRQLFFIINVDGYKSTNPLVKIPYSVFMRQIT